MKIVIFFYLCTRAKCHEFHFCSILFRLQIVVNENITKIREDDIYSMFLSLDQYFGRKYVRETPMFKMYSTYDSVPNVIFPVRYSFIITSFVLKIFFGKKQDNFKPWRLIQGWNCDFGKVDTWYNVWFGKERSWYWEKRKFLRLFQ